MSPYGPIYMTPYDESWPARYEAEAAALRETLGEAVTRIEHVGSTAIPGLAAKPVIDVQVSLADPLDPGVLATLEGAGYEHRPLGDSPEHRFLFRAGPKGERLVHVHLCTSGSEWERKHILFRDFMRAHPEEAAAYLEEKRRLAAMFNHTLPYAEAKTPYIEAVMERAEAWASKSGSEPA